MPAACSSATFTATWCLLVLLVGAAPYKTKEKKAPELVFDQKQTGDYNIHVHLEDFQIIALLGDDPLAEDDYDYDYADFTIKPPGSSSTTTTTTTKPAPANQTVEPLPGGQIQVQILEDPAPLLGESAHYHRCPSGTSRSKKGRCRKLTNRLNHALGRLALKLRLPLQQP